MGASMAEMRTQAVEDLGWQRLDTARYNVDGIIRDAWINGNGSDETWHAAVEKNRYPYLIGDTVRVVVEIDGFDEHLYGTVESFRTADNRMYRRRVLKPHSAYVELFEYHTGALRPLAEITPEADDFEIATEHAVVHHNGPSHNYGIYLCNSQQHGYPPPADALVTHKRSGTQRRLCNTCNNPDQRARLGHLMWRDRQRCLDTIRRLTAHPEEIAGRVGDFEAEEARGFADVYPYLMPAGAAERYEQWKQQNTGLAA